MIVDEMPVPFEHIGTHCVHGEYDSDPLTGAVMPPISLATTFKQSSPGVPVGEFEYSRSSNPTRSQLEKAVAKLENGKHSSAFSSGCMAMTTLAHLVKPGGHVLMINDVYGGTNRLFTKVAPNYGFDVSLINMLEPESVKKGLKENTKMVWIETPTNPTLMLADIEVIAKIVHAHSNDIILVVDNTFMSPVFQRPLDLGADIVLHSATKYLNGHCDVVMGLVATSNDQLHERITYFQNALGGIPSPFDCYLVFRGLKTLHIRMERHDQNAMKIAKYLKDHAKVERVVYPGLQCHPQHELAKRQQRGFGGMISVALKGTQRDAVEFTKAVKIFTLAESLGGVESLIEIPYTTSYGQYLQNLCLGLS